MKITAVVVTRNRPALLARVLFGLHGQTRPLDQIIVFDNASTQETRDLLMRHRELTVLRSERNVGGAGGFAQGLEAAVAAGAHWVWLLDDDAVPEHDALEHLLRAAVRLPSHAGGVCAAVTEFDALALQHRRCFSALAGRERVVAAHAYERDCVEIDTGSFVGFLARASAVLVAGLPRSDYFIAYDDTEYSLRLKASGFSLWLVPASRITHLRERVARMRHSRFGTRHYYNVRNRIAVATAYSRWTFGATVLASLYGVALWTASRQPWRPESIATLARAIADGRAGRLGERLPPPDETMPPQSGRALSKPVSSPSPQIAQGDQRNSGGACS
jgi:rhamnopyranosyl-N-acetylglucosaminyl-diphospho-decaprenol beta-1,3/1,4-galactofuranosyltransferase